MKFKTNIMLMILMLTVGCSSAPQKVELESSDPSVVIKNIQQFKNDLIRSNSDVLAKDSFKQGDYELSKAIKASQKNKPLKDTLGMLAQSKAYFLR